MTVLSRVSDAAKEPTAPITNTAPTIRARVSGSLRNTTQATIEETGSNVCRTAVLPVPINFMPA